MSHSINPSTCLPQELLKTFKGLDSVQRADGGDLSMQGMTQPLSVHGNFTGPTSSFVHALGVCNGSDTVDAAQVLFRTVSTAAMLI